MNKFERNKIIGAIFASLLVLMVVRGSAHKIFEPQAANPNAFKVVDMDASGAPASGPEKQAPQIPLPVLLAKANITSGAKVSRICQACHNLQEGAGPKVGPDLYAVVGRPVAHAAGFSYTQAMQKHAQDPKTKTWTFENLFIFLKDPRAEVPGTAMSFAGIEDPQKRADLIAYLNTLGSNLALPPVPKEAAEADGDKSDDKNKSDKNKDKDKDQNA